MTIISPSVKKGAATIAATALLALNFGSASATYADPVAINMVGASSTVLAANGSSTVLQTFSPDLGLDSSLAATLEQNATSSTDAYYGVTVTPATSSPDVHWRITVHNATSALTSGDVSIQEVGTYNATSGRVRTSPATYSATESSGDLVLTGNTTGWSITSGSDFTNIDQITFGGSAPSGTYTVTRELIDESSGTAFMMPFAFTVDLTAAATSTPDTTAPDAPVVTFPSTNPYATSDMFVSLAGTAEASSTITVSGGGSASPTVMSADGSGTWFALVSLNASSTNTLSITATDAAGNVSATTTIDVIQSAATSTGTTTPDTTAPAAPIVTYPSSGISTSTNPVTLRGTAEANSAIAITGSASTAHATTSGAGSWSASVTLTASSTNTLHVSATDAAGNTSSSTTFVITQAPVTPITPSATSSPIITLTGSSTITTTDCGTFAEPGFSAVDSTGASITATSTGTAGIRTPGTYVITYSAMDAYGHVATTSRTVIIENCRSGNAGLHGGSSRPPTQGQFTRSPFGSFLSALVPGQVFGPNFFVGIPATSGEVLGASTFQFVSDLKLGMSGAEVEELQARLSQTPYYKGPITGYFGALTRAALMKLQRANGLSASGMLDAQTRTLLNS